jgi:hypothetical protein
MSGLVRVTLKKASDGFGRRFGREFAATRIFIWPH